MKYIIVLLINFLLVLNGVSQDRLEISLKSLLEMAKVDNPTLQLIQLQEDKAKAELELEKKWWMPSLKLQADLHQLWGNVMNSDGRIFTDVDRQSFSGALGIGTVIDLQKGSKNKNLKAYELRSKSIRSQIDRNNYVLELIEVYYQLLSLHQEKTAYQNLMVQSDVIIEQLRVLVKEGLQYNTDLLLAKSNRNNLHYQYQEAAIKAAELESTLLTLLYRDIDTEILLLDSLLVPIELVTKEQMSNSNVRNNPLFKYLENQQAAKNYEYKNEKNGILLPKIWINAYTGLFGDVFTNIAPTHGINGGIGWDIPLSRFSGDQLEILDIEKSIINQEMNQFSTQMKNKVAQTDQQLTLIREQIQSTEQAIDHAYAALQETIQRQELGLSRPFEIELAQEAFIKSRINYLHAVARYNTVQYRLFVDMGNNF